MFDVGLGEVLLLLVVALFIFGPDRLPKVAAQAGRALRDLRSMAAGARKEIQDSIGPEFEEFKDLKMQDLNPRTFVRKQLMDDPDVTGRPSNGSNGMSKVTPKGAGTTPFDADAT